MSTPVVPFVRKLIPCLKVELTGKGADRQFRLTEPLTAIDQPDARVDLDVYVAVSGGLGITRVHMEVWHSVDDRAPRNVGVSSFAEIGFTAETRGVSVAKLRFSVRKLSMRIPGLYEFFLVAEDRNEPTQRTELPGERAEIRVLSKSL